MVNKKLILVDTGKVTEMFIRELVSPLNYDVVHAINHEDAKEFLLHAKSIDVAVVSMEFLGAQQLIDELLDKSVPTILLSDSEDESTREKLLKKDIIGSTSKADKEGLQELVTILQKLEKNSTKKILLVDDSALFRHYMTGFLKRHRFRILEAENGEEALKVLGDNQDIKLIISDYDMPKINGLQLVHKVRKVFPSNKLPIIIVSASGKNSVTTACLKEGANDYLHKPFEREEFLSRINLTLNNQENIDTLNEQKILLEELSQNLEHRVIEEISKNKQQASHMLQQSRMAQMGEMISMIAHQWRQPLASISAIAGTLTVDTMMDNYKKEFFQERLEAISNLSQHLSSTINDFRSFFKEKKEEEKISLSEIVDSSLKIIGSTLQSKNITIETEIIDDIVLKTYPNEIKQVLLNLLKNSEEAFEDNRIKDAKILIRGYRKEDRACLAIEDNAGGIRQDIIDKVFDPYFSTKSKKDGTGLGLYMSKTIIEEHCGGKITIKNITNGACFELLLPLKLSGESEK